MLTGGTRLVGLIGNPVSHSLSPRMQNAAFAARGLDWAYVPLAVEAEQLEAAALGLVALGFAGANVTTPYKTAILAYCDDLDEVAERAGSVNTLVVRDGRLFGSSTDGQAVDAVDVAGASVLVLGAGGAAQALATAIADAGAASLAIAARSAERAHALGVRLRTLFPELGIHAEDDWPPARSDAGVVVNATPIRDEVLVEPRSDQHVVDVAYNSDGRPTAFIARAREIGCETVDGLDVLVAQGAASFERWTRIPAPVDVMRAALRHPSGAGLTRSA